MEKSCFVHVKNFFHPYLLPLKAVYFFQLGAAACLIPYIPLFIQHLGLNAAENGILFGALPFIAMVSKPSAGALSDKFKAPFLFLRIFTVIQLVSMSSVYFVPALDRIHRTPYNWQPSPALSNISCTHTSFALSGTTSFTSWIVNTTTISNTGNFTCIVNATVPGDDESFTSITIAGNSSDISAGVAQLYLSSCWCSWTPSPSDGMWEMSGPSSEESALVRWTYQFWVTGLVLAIGWFGYGAAVTLNDAIAFSVVESSPVKTTYGANRVLGTMGWAVCALLIGLLLDTFSDTPAAADRDFTPAFATFGVVGSCTFVATFFLRMAKPAESPKPAVKAVVRSLLTLEVLLFCSGTFVAGINSGMLYGYLAWYQSELGGSNILIGVTVFVQACYEAPMMAISGWIIRKVGYHGCMLMCLLSFGIRFMGYYWMVNPWFVLLIDIVHSVGYGLFYACMTNFAYEKAPPGATATLQGVLGATYEGFGQGIGGIAAGFLYQTYGGRTTWLGYGIFSLVATVFYGFGGFVSRMKKYRGVQIVSVNSNSQSYPEDRNS